MYTEHGSFESLQDAGFWYVSQVESGGKLQVLRIVQGDDGKFYLLIDIEHEGSIGDKLAEIVLARDE